MNMLEIIAADFEVEPVAQEGKVSLLAAAKNECFHFVFYTEKGGYNELKQYFIHRFELALRLLNSAENKCKEYALLPSVDLVISFGEFPDPEEQTIRISHNGDKISFPLYGNSFGEILLADAKTLESVYKDSEKKTFRKKIITAITDNCPEDETSPLSRGALTVAAFEQHLIKPKRVWRNYSDVRAMLESELLDSLETDPYMMDNLLSSLPIVVGRTECDCGSEGCFFDMLKKAYDTFFIERDLLTNGEIDEQKVNLQFADLWSKLSPKQRAVINHLDEKFGNTPLINLYLLTRGADEEEYIYKMTFPYQPDSEDDAFIRKSVSLVSWWLNQ
jgi:hypothetical protein